MRAQYARSLHSAFTVVACLTATACIAGSASGTDQTSGGSTAGGTTANSTGGTAGEQTTITDTRPSVASYVGKIKTLLTGQAPTDQEIANVVADPNALQTLVNTWMQTPQYESTIHDFYSMAFQQQLDSLTASMFAVSPEDSLTPNLLANVQDSFAYTVEELNTENQPFTQVLTTPRYMMTVPLMMLYAYVDAVRYGDNDKAQTNTIFSGNPNLSILLGSANIAAASSRNPNDPNYMRWTLPNVATMTYKSNSTGSCAGTDPIVLSQSQELHEDQGYYTTSLLDTFLGRGFRFNSGGLCLPVGNFGTPFITNADYSNWRMITIRAPKKGESTTKFYDLDTLRNGTELVLHNPRVGFFGTYAFQALWQTNISNQFRVTMNQSMIVALGQAFDGSDQTRPLSLAAMDTNHAVPGTACYACHMTLDPMRQFFHQAYTVNSAAQQDANFTQMPGQFAWDGTTLSGNSLTDLGTAFANSPRFAASWVQKLCTFARSSPCSSDDPAFLQIVSDFKSSGYNFDAMAAELFSSPLVTYAQPTQTEAQTGQVYAVKKQGQMCAAISARLGIEDACALELGTPQPNALQAVRIVQTTLASDNYSRGAVAPTQANSPGLLFASGMENVCKSLANYVVDNGKNSLYSSGDPQMAIASMVHTLMGINPARDAVPIQVLQHHYSTAQTQSGQTPTTALQSTFVLACMAPSTLSLGQ